MSLKNKFKLTMLAAATSLMLSGCTLLHTEYKAPQFEEVKSFADAQKYTGEQISANYWQEFKDEKLNKLIDIALENNFDLRQSYVSVEKALLYFDISHTNYHPSANASLGESAKRALDYHQSFVKSSNTSLSLSYQLDLFGKLAAQDESALQSYRASAYDYLAMRLTVVETVARAYWQYAFAKEAYEIGLEDLNDSNTRLKLVEAQFNLGAADNIDLDNARIDNLNVKSTLDNREAALKKAKTALNTALGYSAEHEFEVASLDDATIPSFSLEVPVALLANRPDLMADEATLKRYYANYNQAKMAFFPDITLNAGLAAGGTNTFGQFLSNPIGTLGAAITLPFLNFNKLNLEEERAFKDIDYYNIKFVGDYIKAIQEVYDGVVNCSLYEKNIESSEKTYELAKSNYHRYDLRYRLGSVSLTDFLKAADTLRSSHIALLQAKLNRLNETITLMGALGGDSYTKNIDEIVKD